MISNRTSTKKLRKYSSEDHLENVFRRDSISKSPKSQFGKDRRTIGSPQGIHSRGKSHRSPTRFLSTTQTNLGSGPRSKESNLRLNIGGIFKELGSENKVRQRRYSLAPPTFKPIQTEIVQTETSEIDPRESTVQDFVITPRDNEDVINEFFNHKGESAVESIMYNPLLEDIYYKLMQFTGEIKCGDCKKQFSDAATFVNEDFHKCLKQNLILTGLTEITLKKNSFPVE